MTQFVGIPSIPEDDVSEGQVLFMNAVKENLELITGTRNQQARGSRAILKREIRVEGLPPAPQNIGTTPLTVQAQGFEIDGTTLASFQDYVRLINDMVVVKNDIAALVQENRVLRQTVSALIEQLRN